MLDALVNIAAVKDVLVVGSVAREGYGNDLDVVVVVDDTVYNEFLATMACHGSFGFDEKSDYDDYYVGYRLERVHAAIEAITSTPTEYGWLLAAMERFGAELDIHPMPHGWMNKVDTVQTHLPHKDPNFVRNIAGDARALELDDWGKGFQKVYCMS